MKTILNKKFVATALLSALLWFAAPTGANAQIVFETEQQAYQNADNRSGINNEGDDVNDEAEAPINGLLGLGLLVGAYLGYRKYKNAQA